MLKVSIVIQINAPLHAVHLEPKNSSIYDYIYLVLVTVTIYGLFLYDSKAREGTWEHLDDAVYYVRSLGNTVEFCFAVFLFFNGGWILLFESGGTIRALMMLIHAYCNIWCEAKSGKINNL